LYYAERHYDYWLSGLKDYLRIKQALAKYALKNYELSTVFELGCASGRVLRHFLNHEPNLEIWGSDIKLSHIDWVLKNLNSSGKVFQNSIIPSLPIEDNYLSLLYAFSVFTHIDEFELAWLAELRRILKPGGIAYITIVTENTWKNLNPNIPVYQALIDVNDFIEDYDVTPDFFKALMPQEKVVFKWKKLAEVYNCSVFHSTQYIYNIWGRFFEILDIIPEHSDFQDVVILRKS
jgi:ubiquinone/menaquinone biosynthesis C-methylase UbiE